MQPKIWKNFDQSELDAQYSTRAQIGDGYESWAAHWRRESEMAVAKSSLSLDVPYGPHAREKMDLFSGSVRDEIGPVAVFFHGGFWRSRDKSDYSYVVNGLSSLGALVAVVNYPLCPASSLAQVVTSARRAVRWLMDHATEFGGDPNQIYLFGHSAGAHLAAACCCGDGGDADELPGSSIKAVLLTSGLYELEPVRLCFANADIRLDPEQVDRLSPTRLSPLALAGPMIVAFGGAETQEFEWQATQFRERMAKHGASARVVRVPDANHYTIVPQFGASDSLLITAFRNELERSPTG